MSRKRRNRDLKLIAMTYWQAFHQIMRKVDTSRGAPMGRPNVGSQPVTITSGRNGRIYASHQTKVYQRRVALPYDGAYDAGGAYWGIGKPLYVRFTKDLSYVEFFRA
jgi:hypothetical protein